jgi:hypothetical protein
LTLRKTAAFHLLRRFGAERCGNSLAVGRALLMARLREMQEHPDWRWGRERRGTNSGAHRRPPPNKRRSLVPVGEALQQRNSTPMTRTAQKRQQLVKKINVESIVYSRDE